MQSMQEIGFTHMKVLEGLDTIVQLTALVARLSRFGIEEEFEK